MVGLRDGPHFDGEGLHAGVALVQPNPGGLACQPADMIGPRAALRAHRAVRSHARLQESECGFLVLILRGCKIGLAIGIAPMVGIYP
jgi:hypothetical protein